MAVIAAALFATAARAMAADYEMPPFPEAPYNLFTTRQAVGSFINAIDKTKAPFSVSIPWLEALRDSEPYATNAEYRLVVNNRILDCCRMARWGDINRYDPDYCNAKLVALCKALIADPGYSPRQKEPFAAALANERASAEDFAESEKIARAQIARAEALDPPDPLAACGAWLLLADVFRWQDRKAEMVAAIDKARSCDPLNGTIGGSERALDYGGLDDVIATWWRDLGRPYDETIYFHDKNLPERARKTAYAFVMCPTNAIGRRIDIAQRYFCLDNAPDARAARKAVGAEEAPKLYNWRASRYLNTAFGHGDYRLVADIFDDLSAKAVPVSLANPPSMRLRIVSLGAIGQADRAAALAREHAADEANTPLDTLKYQVYAAILSGEDALPVIAKSPCDRKEKMEATLDAAQRCQIWDNPETSEKYAAAYLKYFAPDPARSAKVVWSDTPVSTVADWRQIAPRLKLEEHFCDIPYTHSLEFLETDVATGREKVVAGPEERRGRMSFTTVADRYALHIFLRVEDPEARLVEAGTKRGVTTEMYFAPGANQAYTCFGSNPRDGLTFDFPTSYSSAIHQRLDRKALSGPHFTSEVAFSDSDYFLHMSFPWDDFYQKLPSPSAEWKFECWARYADGGQTWGGSHGIHNASQWGTLKIDLTPAQLAEVRRGILVRMVRAGWRNKKFAGGATLDYFDMWKDAEIGDPGFYETCLKSLDEELSGYADRIKPDMSDAEANDVYEKGLVRMKGLKYEIDRLRRDYLSDKLTE